MIDGYRNYIFDFDGTIANLDVDWRSLKNEVNYFYKKFFIENNVQLNFKIDALKDHMDIYSIIKKYEQPNACVSVMQKSSMVKYIKKLDQFYIISNNLNSTVTSALKILEINKTCSKVLGIDDVKNSKPNQESFIILQNFLKEGKSIYFGDRDSDKSFAKNCNIDFYDVRDL